MNQSLKEQRRRERLREYDTTLAAAASALSVLAMFVRARESRARGESLEELFAGAASAEEGAGAFPAAVWVALRQNDIEAALELLVAMSHTDFLIAEHEEVDGEYRLVSIEENRGLPELDRLHFQLAKTLHVPVDVLEVVAGWGPEDPRTASEIESLLDDRFGAPVGGTAPLTGAASAAPEKSTGAQPSVAAGGLRMSAGEFGELLNLSPDQRRVLATLVRQATITIDADE